MNDEDRADDLEMEATRVPLSLLARLLLHEQTCALRWRAIQARMGRMEWIIVGAAGVLITGMGGIIMSILLHK